MVMAEAKWEPGTPTLPGIYWFDNGSGFVDRSEIGPAILQITKGTPYYFGDGGCGPLDCYYIEKLMPNAKFANIEQPKQWTKLTSPSDYGKNTRCWVKSPEGYIGFGLLHQDSHGIRGTIVWLNHPNTASASGAWIKPNDNYEFSPVKIPGKKDGSNKKRTKTNKRTT